MVYLIRNLKTGLYDYNVIASETRADRVARTRTECSECGEHFVASGWRYCVRWGGEPVETCETLPEAVRAAEKLKAEHGSASVYLVTEGYLIHPAELCVLVLDAD